MGYTVAAYAIVVGALVAYGIRVQRQRRTLIRRSEGDGPGASGS